MAEMIVQPQDLGILEPVPEGYIRVHYYHYDPEAQQSFLKGILIPSTPGMKVVDLRHDHSTTKKTTSRNSC